MAQLAIIERNANGSLSANNDRHSESRGYTVGDYDVSALNNIHIQGYALAEPMSARHAIEPLQVYAPFDLIESAGQLKVVLRGGSATATVASSEWRAAPENKRTTAAASYRARAGNGFAARNKY